MSDCGDIDTLNQLEERHLRMFAAEVCPTHRFEVCANTSGQSWVVLEPATERSGLLRFTICRIEPSVMVMVEDHDRRRQFCSVASVEDAMQFVRMRTDQAVLSATNAHPAHPVLQ